MKPSVFFSFVWTFRSVLYFATITRLLRHTTCWRTAVVPWDVNVISLEILMRVRGKGGWGDEPRLDLAWGWRVGRNEGWAVYLRRRFSVFLPLAICQRSRDAYQAHRFPEESRLSSHLSLSLSDLSSFLGGVSRDSVVPRRGYILSSRNNKLTLLNLSWAAFRSSSLRQQRAPAYLPTNIVTAFNSVIYLMLHAF